MGQWQSTIARKPLSGKAKQSLAIIPGDSCQQRQEDEVNNPSPQPTSGVLTPSKVFSYGQGSTPPFIINGNSP
ncbi:hypothetical protein ABVK25_007410 [Lepraria finkii]|uniref:Uncharacterized protein n=1 Tax=Lepraria finkii TaxID=1340010 RepID=A0ABR4B5B9_9LECA